MLRDNLKNKRNNSNIIFNSFVKNKIKEKSKEKIKKNKSLSIYQNKTNSKNKKKSNSKPKINNDFNKIISNIKNNNKVCYLKKIFKKPKLSLYQKKKLKNNSKEISFIPFYKKKKSKNKLNYTMNTNVKLKDINEESIIKNKIKINNIINYQNKIVNNNVIILDKKKENNNFNYDFYTKKGYNSTMPKKKNQDRYFVKLNLNKNPKINLFGICDGHGVYGELVSDFIKINLPIIIENLFKSQIKVKLENIKIDHLIYSSIEKLVKKISNSKINLLFSGSTLNFCLIIENKIYIANIGDSRSIINYENSKNKNITKALSYDHKPNLKEESERILKAGGRIDKIIDNYGNKVGPYRVWLKKENYPGLAMSRSIGDLVAFSVGVTWSPAISIYNIDKKDKILFLASDGVFEVLDNKEIMNILIPFYEKNEISKSTKKLSKELDKKWAKEASIDDISFITIFLNK